MSSPHETYHLVEYKFISNMHFLFLIRILSSKEVIITSQYSLLELDTIIWILEVHDVSFRGYFESVLHHVWGCFMRFGVHGV
jgi:hypothetical protein